MNNKQKTGLWFNAPLLLSVTVLTLFSACRKTDIDNHNPHNFEQENLVANTSEYHPVTIDTTLINAFGIAWSPNGIAWVNSVGGHVSELYDGEGRIARAPVNIPSPTDTIGGLPCGIVFSTGKGFDLSNGPSIFLFTGFDGVLSGWNPASGSNAQRLKNPPNARYTGLAIGTSSGRNLIYGANFKAGKIDVWDTQFSLVPMTFIDPYLPAGYSPYNIQAVGDVLFVMYAELSTSGPNADHAVEGAGKGFVSVFNTDGSFIKRFASAGALDVPWGVTVTPGGFLDEHDITTKEAEGNDDGYKAQAVSQERHDPKDPVILVGNFGDGHINVFSLGGRYLGQLKSHNHTVVIDGLWALSFAPSTATSINPNKLYFTAGPDHESDGVFGYLVKK